VAEAPDVAVRSLPDAPHLEWLTSATSPAGEFLSFELVEAATCEASALARLYRERGVLVATLLDVRWSAPVRSRVADVVDAVLRELRSRGAQSVFATTTCDVTAAAFRATGFLRRSAAPALIWPGNQLIPDGAVRLSAMRGDGGLFPLPPAMAAAPAVITESCSA